MLLLCAVLLFRIETRGAVQTEGVQNRCHTGQTKWQHRSGQTLLPHCQGKKQCVWYLIEIVKRCKSLYSPCPAELQKLDLVVEALDRDELVDLSSLPPPPGQIYI